MAGAAEDNYFEQESEDNDSEEEGDVDEDTMDINWGDWRKFVFCGFIVKLNSIVGITK